MFHSKHFAFLLIACQVLSVCVSVHGGGMKTTKVRAFTRSEPRNGIPYRIGHRSGSENFAPKFGLEEAGKVLGLTKVILSPVIIPMILFVGIVLLLFFAVVGSSAVVGGALGRNRVPYRHVWAKQLSSTAKLASDVLESEECVEKLACELFRKARGHTAENWITKTLDFLPMRPNWMGRIARSMRSTSDCQEFNCMPASRIGKALKMLHIASSS